MPTYIRVKDLPNAATSPAADDFILLSGAANGARRISRADFLSAVAGFYTADPSTYKLATLDAGDKVLVSQLPSSAFSYQGTWAASTNTPTLANGTGTGGDTYYASDSGSVNFGAGSISFLAGDAVVYDGSVWQKVPDVVNLLDGKGTLDEAKTTLEIPDVGTDPSEVPLNQHLGSMAYQDADSVSVAELQVESTTGTATTQALTVTDGTDTNFVVQEGGNVGVGLSSPSGSGWDESATVLHVKKDDTSGGLLALESSNTKAILNAGNNQLAIFTTTADPIRLGTSGSEAVRIDSLGALDVKSVGGASAAQFPSAASVNGITALPSATGTPFIVGRDTGSLRSAHFAGHLKFDSGYGIDFGSTNSTSGVTVTGSTLDHYEEGTWTGTFRDATSGGNASSTFPGVYTRIGDVVYFRIGCGNINTSGMTAGNVIYLHGLPFQASASKSGPVNAVQVDTVTTGDYLTVAANAGTSYCDFRKNTSGAGDAQLLVSDLTSGTSDMTVSGWYYA